MALAKAPYGRRVLAWFIDTMCTSLVSAVVVGIGFGLAVPKSVRPLGIGILIISPVVIIGFVLWNSVFRQGRTGQSIGKRLMGTKLVSIETGNPLGAGSTFVRGLVAWALNTVSGGLFAIVDYLFPAFDKDGQRVVDKMLKTQVTLAEGTFSTVTETSVAVSPSSLYG